MKKALIITILIVLVLIISVPIIIFTSTEFVRDKMVLCKQDSDCILVDYASCSGKLAINQKYKLIYNLNPALQRDEWMGSCVAKIAHVDSKCEGGICSPIKWSDIPNTKLYLHKDKIEMKKGLKTLAYVGIKNQYEEEKSFDLEIKCLDEESDVQGNEIIIEIRNQVKTIQSNNIILKFKNQIEIRGNETWMGPFNIQTTEETKPSNYLCEVLINDGDYAKRDFNITIK